MLSGIIFWFLWFFEVVGFEWMMVYDFCYMMVSFVVLVGVNVKVVQWMFGYKSVVMIFDIYVDFFDDDFDVVVIVIGNVVVFVDVFKMWLKIIWNGFVVQ